MFSKKKSTITALLLSALLFGGCAPKNWDAAEDGAYDELEPINRELFKINKGLDFVLLKPIARAYRLITPPPLQTAIGNMTDNLQEPANIANNAMQRQGDAAVNSAARFVFNSTFGLGGIFDVADDMGIKGREADFGQTLRAYGLDTTYLVLPVVGPSTVSDGIGIVADSRLFPLVYLHDDAWRNASYGVIATHTRAQHLDDTDLAEGAALDEYSFIRDIYEERRQADVPSDVWEF